MSRPRGVVTDWVDDPNAFVQVGMGETTEPLMRATQVEAHRGLVVEGRLHQGLLPTEPEDTRFEKRHLPSAQRR